MSSEFELSLRCEELLVASPSTSSHNNRDHRRRCQPVNQKRMSHPMNNRKRPSEDSRLNSALSPGVKTLFDRALFQDERVLENLRKSEIKRSCNPMLFISFQDVLEPTHREQCVEWLSEICREMNCDDDVFPLAVIILDRYLSIRRVPPKEIQAVAGICLFIASKLKAPTPVNTDDLVYWSSQAIESEVVMPLETLILECLDWDVCSPTAMDFYDQILARLPQIASIRGSFVDIIHGIQKNYKLATLLPSVQCALALLNAAKQWNPFLFQEIAGFSPGYFNIPDILSIDLDMLLGLLPMVDRTMGVESLENSRCQLGGSFAPPCSHRTPSPQLQTIKAPFLSTPINQTDSGFCSGASSPESACKKDEMECSPPKMSRLS